MQAWLRPSQGEFALHIEGADARPLSWNVSRDQLSIYRWIARAAEPFSFAELRAQFPDASDALVHDSFQRVVDSDFLVPVE